MQSHCGQVRDERNAISKSFVTVISVHDTNHPTELLLYSTLFDAFQFYMLASIDSHSLEMLLDSR
jgi:hypothetical protein